MTSAEFTSWRKASYSDANGGCVEVAAEFTGWRKASYSSANGGCVEVAEDRASVGVRDTQQHGCGPVLEFPGAAWRSFIARVRTVQLPREQG
jgi:hypothetical protein